MDSAENSTITVLTAAPIVTRGLGDILYQRNALQSHVLANNINVFLVQMGTVLDEVPESVGGFRLTEISVSAEITAEGKVVLCGVGGNIGISGGLEFVFKRSSD